MTEKRFNIEFDGHQYFLVIDEVNERCLARLDTKSDADAWLEMYKMLSEENKQLKQSNQELNDELQETMSYLALKSGIEKENEQLKQYIYDNLDEDIYDVCSYQYLEKSQMDKYYVAKCKKGDDNCSKGTVIHCKDFKFKELQE